MRYNIKEVMYLKKYNLTAEDVAKNFNVSKRTVYYWAASKGLPCTRIGTLVRFSEEEVEEWRKQQNEIREGE